jgi:hypothetical protein
MFVPQASLCEWYPSGGDPRRTPDFDLPKLAVQRGVSLYSEHHARRMLQQPRGYGDGDAAAPHAARRYQDDHNTYGSAFEKTKRRANSRVADPVLPPEIKRQLKDRAKEVSLKNLRPETAAIQ